MAEVKWIKVTTDVFDDEKILLIESLPEADSIIVIWFKLLCLAGKQNNSGVFMMGDRIAYTDKMLATIFRRKEATVQLALQTFEQFGMIEMIDNVITIPNWGKHQSLDQIESKKEYMKNYMKEYREKQRALSSGGCKSNSKTNSKANVRQAEKEIDKEKEIETDKDNKRIIAAAAHPSQPSTPKKTKNDKVVRKRCGEFRNVLLSDDEEEKLIDEFGIEFALRAIKFLDEYIEETGYKRKNHYLCIKRWVIDAAKEKEAKDIKAGKVPKSRYGDFDVNEAFNIALERSYGSDQSKTAAEDDAIRERAEALRQRLS